MTDNPNLERLARALAKEMFRNGLAFDVEPTESGFESWWAAYGKRELPHLSALVRAVLCEMKADMNMGSLWRVYIDSILEEK